MPQQTQNRKISALISDFLFVQFRSQIPNPLMKEPQTVAVAKKIAKKPSLDDLLGRMDKTAKPSPTLRQVDKRPKMDLPPDVIQEFARLVGFHEVWERVCTKYENQKDDVEELLFREWTQYVWNNKCIPSQNPKLACKVEAEGGERQCSGLFQVQKRYKIEFPEGGFKEDETAEDFVVDLLTKLGVEEETAMQIVNVELNFTPKRGVKNINDVMKVDGGREAVTRFLTMCFGNADRKGGTIEVEPLTDKDRELLFYKTASVEVADGFFDRVPTYVKSLDELRAVFTVIQPVKFPSHMKLVSDNEFAMLVSVASDILGFDFDAEKAKEKAKKEAKKTK